jgi:hypothetical protein
MFRHEIQAGIELLNERAAEGWFNRINLDELKMSDCYKCVLGQLFQEYAMGWALVCPDDEDDLWLTEDSAATHGFDVLGSKERFRLYDMLTDEWVEAIEKLRADHAQAGYTAVDLCLVLFIVSALLFDGWMYVEIANTLKGLPTDIASVIAAAVGF